MVLPEVTHKTCEQIKDAAALKKTFWWNEVGNVTQVGSGMFKLWKE